MKIDRRKLLGWILASPVVVKSAVAARPLITMPADEPCRHTNIRRVPADVVVFPDVPDTEFLVSGEIVCIANGVYCDDCGVRLMEDMQE